MTLNIDSIFGTDPGNNHVIAPVVNPVDSPVVACDLPAIEPWPIIEGSEHFSIWVSDDPIAAWPEFAPGYHVDVRQPSRLRPLLGQRCDGGTGQ